MTTRANTPDERIFAIVGADAKFDEGKTKGDLDFLGTQIPDAASFDLERWLSGGLAGRRLVADPRAEVIRRSPYRWIRRLATQTTPRVGIQYRIPLTTVDLVASWGEGFKLPSFYALGSPTVGNSELRPERSESWEAGFESTLCDPGFGGKFRYFDSPVKDLIDFSVDTFDSRISREFVLRGSNWSSTRTGSERLNFAGTSDGRTRSTDE